jgi:hypothetical protein
MATRTFAVYVDSPQDIPSPKPILPSRTSSFTTLADVTVDSNILGHNKENVDPVTGELKPTVVSGKNLKRKTTALTVKALCLSESNLNIAQTTSSDAKPVKKRKSVASTTSTTSTTTTARKTKKPSSKKSTKPLSRSSSLMPRVDEEVVESSEAKEARWMSQAAIDARCYDLTVSPLADVSEAYHLCSDATPLVDVESAQIEGSKSPFVRVSTSL